MQRGKVYFSVGEETIISELQRLFGVTELDAIQNVIAQKRELAFMHFNKGNEALAEQLLKEIGEAK